MVMPTDLIPLLPSTMDEAMRNTYFLVLPQYSDCNNFASQVKY